MTTGKSGEHAGFHGQLEYVIRYTMTEREDALFERTLTTQDGKRPGGWGNELWDYLTSEAEKVGAKKVEVLDCQHLDELMVLEYRPAGWVCISSAGW